MKKTSLFLALTAIAGLAFAQTETINSSAGTKGSTGTLGSMVYQVPGGWNMTKYVDGDVLMPTDVPKGEFLEIWVKPSLIISGSLEQALQKTYDETVGELHASKMNEVDGGNYTTVAAKKSFKGWEYIRCSGGIKMGGGDYPPEYGLDLFIVKLNDRFERIVILRSRNNCNLATYYPSDRLKYYDDIQNFLFSLVFSDWKEQEVNSGIASGPGISGVWQGIGLSVGVAKTGAALGAELKVKQAIFFSNGQVYFGTKFPAQGLDELNTWTQAELNRRDWGSYTFSNGRGILKLPYAEMPLRMENDKLIITSNKTDHGFIKMNSVDGATFAGNYALSSKNMAGEETGKTPLINFGAGGRFSDNGAMSILYHEYIDCLNAGRLPGSGTYEVKNYSVIFSYADGRRIKIAFLGTDYNKRNQDPAILRLSSNEDPMKKQ